MKADIRLTEFGKVKAPLFANSDGSVDSYIVFSGEDIVNLLDEIYSQYASHRLFGPKRTQRQQDIAELSLKLKRLIAKEKHIKGTLWSPFINKARGILEEKQTKE